MSKPESGILFLCGVPRSGTTMVQRLITEYFNVRTGQESSVIDGMIIPLKKRVDADRMESRQGLGLSGYMNDDQVKALISKIASETFLELFKNLSEYYGNKKYDYFLEKTPSNVLFVDEILQFIPNTKVIVIDRNVNDIVKSLVRARRSWGSDWVPRNAWRLASFIHAHRVAVEKCRKISNKNILVASYEDICNSPAVFLNQVRVFLSSNLKKPLSKNILEELQTIKTAIPIKRENGWELLKENENFINNRAKLPTTVLLEIKLITLILKLKNLLI